MPAGVGVPDMQVFNLILPRLNCRRVCSWYQDNEPPDMSPTDAQACRTCLSACPPTPPRGGKGNAMEVDR
jgi:hypothetical protein